ncbi:MAG: YbjN domain-containing protein [Pseudomonadota bacterium]
MYRLFLIFIVILTLTPSAFAKDKLGKDYSDDELSGMLNEQGFRSVEIVEPRVLRVTIDGLEYYLFVYDDGDLQLWFGLTNYTVNVADMNDWNKTRRLSRAYIDDENDPILEGDLLANAGYSAKQLYEWVSVFDSIARAFRDFVAERDNINLNSQKRQTQQPDQ